MSKIKESNIIDLAINNAEVMKELLTIMTYLNYLKRRNDGLQEINDKIYGSR